MSLGPFTQAELDNFIGSLRPIELAASALSHYSVPLFLALLVLVPPVRARLGEFTGTARLLPLGLWSICFCWSLLHIDTATRWIWVVRFTIVSMMAAVPIVAVAGAIPQAPTRSRSWALGAWIGFGTVLCDFCLLLLAATRIPEVQ